MKGGQIYAMKRVPASGGRTGTDLRDVADPVQDEFPQLFGELWSSGRTDDPPIVDENALNMMTSSTTPTVGPRRRSSRIALTATASSSSSSKSATSGTKARAASFGCVVSSCWANSAMRAVARSRWSSAPLPGGTSGSTPRRSGAGAPAPDPPGRLRPGVARPSNVPTLRTEPAGARALPRSTGRSCAGTGRSARRPPGR